VPRKIARAETKWRAAYTICRVSPVFGKSMLIRGKKPARRATPAPKAPRGRRTSHCARVSECLSSKEYSGKGQKAERAPVWALDKAPNPKRAKSQKIKPIPGRTREAIEETLPAQVVDLLTAKQRFFVREYLLDLNATQAAIRAGYSRRTASEIGYENLRKPQIMSAIEEALRQFGDITETKLIEELSQLAFSDIGNVVAWVNDVERAGTGDFGHPEGEAAGETRVITARVTILPSATMDPAVRAAVASISQGAGGQLRVKMHDKIAAIDKLARVLGMYRDKSDVTSDSTQIVPVLVYTGAPEKILARKVGNAPPPETGDRDRDESD
jgi:phage terminase small subunit